VKQTNKPRPPSLVAALKSIFEGTSEHTGKQFFKSLVKHLAEVLSVYGVWVTEYKEEIQSLNALAFWIDGKFIEKYEYKIKGTPCEPAFGTNDIVHVPENVIDIYPGDPDLPPLKAVSYMGIALRDIDGKILGNLAMLDQKPMPQLPETFVIFKLFASRAAAELRRIQDENRLHESEAKIKRLLNGTMDAIVELNEDMEITQANAAALHTFRVTREAFVGRSLKQYLEKKAYQKLLDTIPFLERQKNQLNCLWIQGYLECMNSSNESFLADATMSYYRVEKRNYYALYIRDVQDRVEKEATIRKLTVETTMLQEKINDHQMSNILGESEPLRNTLTQVAQVATTDSTVLILGETGTGKELIAHEIHQKSLREDRPFITLNCAALPAELIESELFGHVKGAFTGALNARDGRFVLADKGTIFLDEIGEMPLSLQAKLLRVIQEGEFEPVGSSFTKNVNVRIIAATHKDLLNEVAARRFRGDLFYRLNVFPIHVPPLRERSNDILLLAEAFLSKYAQRHGRAGQSAFIAISKPGFK
jgi:transcriptional regulator with PAS, ATPase and Fis domain